MTAQPTASRVPPMQSSDEANSEQLELARAQGAALKRAVEHMTQKEAHGAEVRAGDYWVGYAVEDAEGMYLHRGIAARSFERRFQLADFIEAGNASFEHGLLTIELKRVVPEAMKPRRIEIGGHPANDRIEGPKEKARDAA